MTDRISFIEEGEEGDEGGKDPPLPGSKRRHRPFLDPLGAILGTCWE
jgi:hypothetical protein